MELTQASRFGFARQDYGPMDRYPHHVPDSRGLALLCTYDPAAVRELLPIGVEPTKDSFGPIVWQINPAVGRRPAHSQFYVGIEVEGHSSPNETPGCFEVGTLIPPNLRPHYAKSYNGRAEPGEALIEHTSNGRSVTARTSNGLVLRCDVSEEVHRQHFAGFTNYLTEDLEGGLQKFPVLCDYQVGQADIVNVEFGPAAPAWLLALKPVFHHAITLDHLSYTFGEVRPIAAPADDIMAGHAHLAMRRLFFRMGRAAVIVDAKGVVHYANPSAMRLSGVRVEEGKPFCLGTPDERGTLMAAIQTASGLADERPLDEVFPLSRAESSPYLARVLPVSGRGDSALITLTDPTAQEQADAKGPLQLLGLTDAEARIASCVGSGCPPQQAAEDLGLSTETVRSALKIAYSKLRISRQAELARLVAILTIS